MASSLLVMYDAEAVYKSLKDKKLAKVRSFGAFSCSYFSKVLDEYQDTYEIEKQTEKQSEELEIRSTNVISERIAKDNKLSRLKNIDVETRPIQSG